jgi:hypothetical protein
MRILMVCLCGVLALGTLKAAAAEKTAIDRGNFEAEVQKLETSKAGAERLRHAKDMVHRHWYSSQQVKAIAMRLPDDDARLDFATAAYSRTIDPENFYDVYDAFTSFSKVFRLHDRIRGFPRNFAPVAAGPEPMSQEDFAPILRALKSEDFDPARLQLARQILGSSRANFLSSQVRDMAKAFDFEPSKLEFAKLAFDYTLDREKYFLVNDSFDFTNTRQALSRYVQEKIRLPQKAEVEH